MRTVLAVSLVVSAIVPLGCAAAGSAPTPTQPPATEQSALRYVALGDSYTIGTSVPESARFPNQLVERLAVSVPLELLANLGVNGYSSADLIAAKLPALGDLQPDLVTLLIGVNDVVRGVDEQQYRANVAQILAALLDEVPADRIVVVSVPDYTRTPRGADYGDPAQQRAEITRFNEIMRAAAEQRGIAFVDISAVADQAGDDPQLVAGDGLHPSGVQYGRWVDLIAPVVESLL